MLERLKWFLSVDWTLAVELKINFVLTLIRARSNTYSSFRPTSSRKDSANWNKIKAGHNRSFNLSCPCNGTVLSKGVCLQHKATYHNTWLQWILCSMSVRGLHAISEKSLPQAGSHGSYLLPASWYLIFILLAFTFYHCTTVKSCCVI